MNKINLNQTGGFPLSTNVLDAMQTAYSIFNSLGELAGNFAIISGCEIIGNTISDGVVYINGEVLEFKGGNLSANVIIKEEAENRTFEDGVSKPVIIKRYATFGTSTPEKTYASRNFKRIDNLIEQGKKNIDFENRLKALETAQFPIPIGLIAIWGKPDTEPIPTGWQEYIPLRDKFPLGYNPDNTSYSDDDDRYTIRRPIGSEGGEETHKLSIEEMPSHSHTYTYTEGGVMSGSGNSGNGSKVGRYLTKETNNIGGNQAHNNMPPYRVIRFIEYVG